MQKTRSSVRTWAPRVALFGLLGFSLAGAYAFKKIFPHSGEQALDLVPESAIAVATLDLDPAPSQAIAFRRIDEALKRNGLSDSLEGMAKKTVSGFADQKELWDLSKHSISACLFSASMKKEDLTGAVLVPLNDAVRAEQILKTKGRPEFWKGTKYYRLPNSPYGLMVEGETLVAAVEPWVFHEMARVASGDVKPVTQSPGFQEARARESADASLLVMISPKMAEMAKSYAKNVPLGWSSVALTVQDGGLAFSMHGRAILSPMKLRRRGRVSSLFDRTLLQVLPAGAFGVYALSQPSAVFEGAESTLKGSDTEQQLQSSEADLRKETGIDVEKDVIPALKGDAVLAAYPSQQPVAGVDFLLVADNQNGAEPQLLAQKLQTYIDRIVSEPKVLGKNWSVQVPRSDGAEFKLSPSIEQKLRSS